MSKSIIILAIVGIAFQLSGLPTVEAFISSPIKNTLRPKECHHHLCTSQFTPNRITPFAGIHAPIQKTKGKDTRTSIHANSHHSHDETTIDDQLEKKVSGKALGSNIENSPLDEITASFQALSSQINTKILPVMALLAFSSVTNIQPAHASFGPGGAVVTSPAVVNAITLDDFVQLPLKKQRQYEGGFLSCTYDVEIPPAQIISTPDKFGRKRDIVRLPRAPKKVCRTTNVIDELLKEIDVMAENDPERASEYRAGAQNLLERQRLVDRRTVEAALRNQPKFIYFGCALLASCIATSIMHPLDTLKVRLMSGKGEKVDDDDIDEKGNPITSLVATVVDLYDGLLPNLLKEGPASALYLGIYEYSRGILAGVPYIQDNVLLVYLLAGSFGELTGSFCRSPAEAVKTRVQAGLFDVPGAFENVFFTEEGRKNTFVAWSAGLFRDVPHGAILITVFELTKALIVDSSIDVDVNTLLAEALLGGLGGGLGAFISTPSDVITTKIITGVEDGGDPPSPIDVLAEVWNEGGLGGLFSGVKVCSLRNHRWEKTVSYVHRTMGTCMHP